MHDFSNWGGREDQEIFSRDGAGELSADAASDILVIGEFPFSFSEGEAEEDEKIEGGLGEHILWFVIVCSRLSSFFNDKRRLGDVLFFDDFSGVGSNIWRGEEGDKVTWLKVFGESGFWNSQNDDVVESGRRILFEF